MGAEHSKPPQPDYSALREDAQFEPKKPAFPLNIIDNDSYSFGGDLCAGVSLSYGSLNNKDMTIMIFKDAKVASSEFNLLDSLDNRFMLKPSNLILKTNYTTFERSCSYITFRNKLFTWKDWLDMKMNEFCNRQGLSSKDRLDMKRNKFCNTQDLSKHKRLWWQFIKPDFKKIFRDYIQAFWYIYGTKIATLTSLTDALFVEYKDAVLVQGLMKPQKRFGDTSRTTKDHLKEFREIMMRVIGGELFGVEDVCEDEDFELEVLNWNTLISYHTLEESFTALDNWGKGVSRDTNFWSILNHLEDEDKVNYDHGRGINIHRFISAVRPYHC
ncbi:hypothetical protein COLO4_29153 [Corchorus olitorius]|uniref:Uncharacterized protein n=1 Tax=Corchorus olitorius TaxID=93759 RepID=A0A1R3HG58_9ROSI|nr:hypothetical protein COLO4_29153 [Corchorus olitorius]